MKKDPHPPPSAGPSSASPCVRGMTPCAVPGVTYAGCDRRGV
ncbi:hypothetical protein STRIP9103_06116 [Streptomyces ipomoeae 91-03]|uniref:Uncharacterized protein n=1 Tax=Streptomyces ipomoeae 91-03 TaxID=698759 RepID=L1KTW4_9ACTN|nr:hypothetical protein STRIP9103_06116 [Streptomyces ipomoeae 91-03]